MATVLKLHEGGLSQLTRWEAEVEAELAELIRDLLLRKPPPTECQVARDLAEWAVLLEFDARRRVVA